MKKSLESHEKVYAKVVSTMRMENHILRKNDTSRIMGCLSGEKTFDSARQELVGKHLKPLSHE